MKKIIIIIVLILYLGCNKEQIEKTYCWDCIYHDNEWTFCDMTTNQIDSLKDVFGYDCPNDLLNCKKQE